MPATATIPPDLLDLFEEPALGHLSYLNEAGQMVTWPIWIDFAAREGPRVVGDQAPGMGSGSPVRPTTMSHSRRRSGADSRVPGTRSNGRGRRSR
jgi:hypothetical protein